MATFSEQGDHRAHGHDTGTVGRAPPGGSSGLTVTVRSSRQEGKCGNIKNKTKKQKKPQAGFCWWFKLVLQPGVLSVRKSGDLCRPLQEV